ncbi:hypothetical protein T459_22495 [Capsicum annuum]|uniref:Aminotransferase-like plant mobile domain-containing protein n=1 Tax=Capsicum annuum TaxID=4072 RepID=A0A2G2YPP9_CAPAN|nr:hypothetical protein T459_22495 [Capsicum annuum]
MMGPTLLDIVALTGLRPHGEEISAVHYAPKLNFTFSKGENGKRSTNYEEFIETNMKREDITEDEHIYFLIMWLCNTLRIAIGPGRSSLLPETWTERHDMRQDLPEDIDSSLVPIVEISGPPGIKELSRARISIKLPCGILII